MFHGVERDFRLLRRLVGLSMPVKFLISPAPRLGVEALRVARLGDSQRRVDEDLDELAVADQARAPCRARRGTAR